MGGTSSSASYVRSILAYDSSPLSAEYTIVVNASAGILMDLNNQNRTGRFDPDRLVSQVLANPGKGQ
eukprot:2710-Eustigmatos_ZCMA.PRE.1